MKTTIIGFPRVGSLRELKFASEKYFRGEISAEELQNTAKELRSTHWQLQQENGISLIPVNDFSFYDNMLDTAVLLNAVPERYRALSLSPLDTYFAMARGYQGEHGDVKAFAMKKWFNTNYHYIVPEIEDTTEIRLAGEKPFAEYAEAKALSVPAKLVLIGPFTFLKLARFTGEKTLSDFVEDTVKAYCDYLAKLNELGAAWAELDEPYLVKDLSAEDIALFARSTRLSWQQRAMSRCCCKHTSAMCGTAILRSQHWTLTASVWTSQRENRRWHWYRKMDSPRKKFCLPV